MSDLVQIETWLVSDRITISAADVLFTGLIDFSGTVLSSATDTPARVRAPIMLELVGV